MATKTLLLNKEDMLLLIKGPERRIFHTGFSLPGVSGKITSFTYGNPSPLGWGTIQVENPAYSSGEEPYHLDHRELFKLEYERTQE